MPVYGNPAQGYTAPPGAKVDKHGYIEGSQAAKDMANARANNPNLIEGPANYPSGGFTTGDSTPVNVTAEGTTIGGQMTPKPVPQTPNVPQLNTPGSPQNQPVIDPNYELKPGEAIPAYNDRVNKYRKGFESMKGKEAPSSSAGAMSAVKGALPAAPQLSVADELFETDDYFHTLQQSIQDYFNPQNQRQSLTQEYQNLLAASGIQALDTELLNMKNVIEGSEDDIRLEVTKAGGFATDSQVLALTNARNKQLIKNYNTLLETRNSKEQYLDKMMDLTVADRAEADKKFDAAMNIGFKMLDYRDKMQTNARNAYQKIVDRVGYDGLLNTVAGDPFQQRLVEKTLGLTPGSLNPLAQLSLQEKAKVEEERALDMQIKRGQISMQALQASKLRKEINDEVNFDGFLDDVEVRKIDQSPQGKKVKALGELKQKVQGYKELVQKYGTETPMGGQKTALDAAYADLKISYKEAANLGALTGPDVALLEEAIKPVTYGGLFAPLKRAFKVATRQGAGNVISGLDTTLNIINRNAETNISQLYARNPKYSSSWYIQELVNPFSDVLQLDDAEIESLMSELSPEQQQELKEMGLSL